MLSYVRFARVLVVPVLLAVAGVGGCAGVEERPAEPPRVTAPPEPWEEMGRLERRGYMLDRVLPVMRAKFQQHDPKEFADFGCETCHGPGSEQGRFGMPSPVLPELYPTGHLKQKRMVERHPEMVKFMFNDVLPTMRRLLGAEPYDETTGEGFSCFACHPKGG